MYTKRTLVSLFAILTGIFLATPAFADKADTYRYEEDFNFVVVDCTDFEVWTKGVQRTTEKLWFNRDDELVTYQYSIHIIESQYYNNLDDTRFISQGQNGVGENFSSTVRLDTGQDHWSGATFRLTIPGIGHVLMDTGTWFWDGSEGVLTHHGHDYVLAEGDTGLALCEALKPID